MTAIELERKIEDMRIQFAKENWDGNTDDMSREDWLSIYALMRTKEYYNKLKEERQIKMKLIVNEKNGCCESVSIEYTPTEMLIINQAMRNYADDDAVKEENRVIMKQMLDVEPIFREIVAESEDK